DQGQPPPDRRVDRPELDAQGLTGVEADRERVGLAVRGEVAAGPPLEDERAERLDGRQRPREFGEDDPLLQGLEPELAADRTCRPPRPPGAATSPGLPTIRRAATPLIFHDPSPSRCRLDGQA